MNSNIGDSNTQADQAGLFSDVQHPPDTKEPTVMASPSGAPRLMVPVRNQVEWQAYDLDSVLPADHAARTVWAFVNALDLKPLYASVGSVRGGAGAPAIDPAILVALWLWATIDGVGSAREVDRLCKRDDAYRWICGGVGVNYHTLADFRTRHEAWLDAQLTRSIASLLDRSLIKLEVVAQDGLRVRAWAKAASFRRRQKLQELHALAQAQVQALKSELQEDAAASTRRKQAARERAAVQREQRLAQALAVMHKITEVKAPKPSKRRGASKDKDDDDDTGAAPPPRTHRVMPKLVQTKEPRVSSSDAQSRVTKMSDGGWRPGMNVQLAVDAQTLLVAGVDVVSGTDMKHMSPMHEQIHKRYGITPEYWLADGGFCKMEGLQQLYERGTQPIVPPYQTRNLDVDPKAAKRDDTGEIAHWRQFMDTEWAKELYLRRGASVEWVNGRFRKQGLTQFNVRGLLKARAVVLWHALAHNLMRLKSLGLALA